MRALAACSYSEFLNSYTNGSSWKQNTSSPSDGVKRLAKLEAQVRQALSSFRGSESPNKPPLPAASTIKQFIEHVESASLRDVDIDVTEIRKCLFSLGLSPDDAALVLDKLDPNGSGYVDARVLAKHYLPNNVGGGGADTNSKRTKFALAGVEGALSRNGGADAELAAEARAMKLLHRKVIERVLVKSKTQNIKDAFRQYDSNKTGSLTLPQFRTFMRDHGFAGTEVERLIKYLDRDTQGSISFRVFSGDVKLGASQAYPKSSPKKQQLPQPLGGSPSKGKGAIDLEPQDPMESIRAKLRQRVMGHNKSIREVFLDFDNDGNGHLDYDEFKRFMAQHRFTVDEATQAIEYLDRDFSGTIDYDEFASGLLFYRPPPPAQVAPSPLATTNSNHAKHGSAVKLPPAKTEYVLNVVQQKLEERLHVRHSTTNTKKKLREDFRRYDADNKSGLDYQEFGAFLVGMGIKLRADELTALVAVVDTDGSEIIEFDEFVKLYPPIAGDESQDDENGGDNDDNDQDGDDSLRGSNAARDEKLVAMFSKYDIDGSGYLDYDEFAQLMRDYGFSESDILRVIKQIDQDEGASSSGRRSDGRVSYATVVSVVQKRKLNLRSSPAKQHQAGAGTTPLHAQWVARVLQKHGSLEDAFCQHDADGSGELDHDEFRRFMKHYGMKSDGTIDALIDEIDGDGNGTVSLDEFMRVFARPKVSNADTQKQQTKARLALLREKEVLWIRDALREYDSVQDAFRAFDRHGRGELSYPQFRGVMEQFGIVDDDDVALLLKRLDVDNSGTIDLREFLTVFSEQRLPQQQKEKTTRTRGSVPTKQPTPKAAALQKRERALQHRRNEEVWIQRASETHGSVRAAFEAFDADGSGTLDDDEFRQLMNAFGISDREHVETLMKRLDLDASGAVDYDEFVTIFYEERAGRAVQSRRASTKAPTKNTAEDKRARAARLRELEVKWMKRVLNCHASIEAAFNEYDVDDSRALDHAEFRRFMTRYGIVREEDIAALIRRLDVDGSGTVDFDEFASVFNPLRIDRGDYGKNHLAGLLPGGGTDDEPFDAEELESILEIERELALRMLEKTRDLRSAFRKYDLNGNGRLEYKEFRQVLRAYRFPELEIRKVIRHLDKNVSGYIDYKAFIAGFAVSKESDRGGAAAQSSNARKHTQYQVARARKSGSDEVMRANRRASNGERASDAVDRLKKELLSKILSTYGTVQSVFRQYDSQQQGCLTEKQFEALVTDHGLTKSDALLLLDAFDQDRSGTIEYAEFLAQLVVRVAV